MIYFTDNGMIRSAAMYECCNWRDANGLGFNDNINLGLQFFNVFLCEHGSIIMITIISICVGFSVILECNASRSMASTWLCTLSPWVFVLLCLASVFSLILSIPFLAGLSTLFWMFFIRLLTTLHIKPAGSSRAWLDHESRTGLIPDLLAQNSYMHLAIVASCISSPSWPN